MRFGPVLLIVVYGPLENGDDGLYRIRAISDFRTHPFFAQQKNSISSEMNMKAKHSAHILNLGRVESWQPDGEQLTLCGTKLPSIIAPPLGTRRGKPPTTGGYWRSDSFKQASICKDQESVYFSSYWRFSVSERQCGLYQYWIGDI